jgi:hypothetical protein
LELTENKNATLENRIQGRWYGQYQGQPMALEFAPDGQLACVFREGDKRQIIKLTYRVEGEYLITDQPSHPREERSIAQVDGSHLVLTFQGVKTRLSRAT